VIRGDLQLSLANRAYRYMERSALVNSILILDLPVTPGPNHDGSIRGQAEQDLSPKILTSSSLVIQSPFRESPIVSWFSADNSVLSRHLPE
jgi:hypothetical protein